MILQFTVLKPYFLLPSGYRILVKVFRPPQSEFPVWQQHQPHGVVLKKQIHLSADFLGRTQILSIHNNFLLPKEAWAFLTTPCLFSFSQQGEGFEHIPLTTTS